MKSKPLQWRMNLRSHLRRGSWTRNSKSSSRLQVAASPWPSCYLIKHYSSALYEKLTLYCPNHLHDISYIDVFIVEKASVSHYKLSLGSGNAEPSSEAASVPWHSKKSSAFQGANHHPPWGKQRAMQYKQRKQKRRAKDSLRDGLRDLSGTPTVIIFDWDAWYNLFQFISSYYSTSLREHWNS